MDISTEDVKYLQKQETEYDVKMTEEDRLFKEDQVSGERKMYCERPGGPLHQGGYSR